jgi:hypothetical protein
MEYKYIGGNPAPFMMSNNWHYGQETCMVCDRKVGKSPYRVEVIEGGSLRDQTKPYESEAGYMGTWAVGSECAKQFDPNTLIKN